MGSSGSINSRPVVENRVVSKTRRVRRSKARRPITASGPKKFKRPMSSPALQERSDGVHYLELVAVAEKERNEAIMCSVETRLKSHQIQETWKRKYFEERKKVIKLWRSYCALKYPQLNTMNRRSPQLLWDMGSAIFMCAQAVKSWSANSRAANLVRF